MISRPAFITKKIACPGCGAENRVRFEQFEMMLELPLLVVLSGHSCQGNPATIEEVRRILLEHLRKENQGNRP
jgi:hypothetical protein